MEVSFSTRKLAKVCNSAKEIKASFGQRMADKLQQRLFELQAAETLDDVPRLPPPRCHEMTGDRKGQLAVDLVHPFRLVFSPDHDPLPKKADGGLDWKQVTHIVIDEVTDYH